MDDFSEKLIARGMLAFQPTIRFTSMEDPVAVVIATINANPKIAYYLHNCTVEGGLNLYTINAQYIHKDTKLSNICVVNTDEECLQYMCQHVGDFRKKLITVVRNTVNLQKVVNEFHVKHTPFYPQLTNIASKGYHGYGEYVVYEFDFTYRIGQVKLNMMEQEVDAEVERITKLLFLPGMPVEAKIYLAHNYLAANVLYRDNDQNSLQSSYTQSAYGAFIKRECVCQGYAEAFKRLMDYAQIECDLVCGQVVGSTEYHAWNIVSIGQGDYYHIDVTWDAKGGRPAYTHFCKADGHYTGKRTWNRELNHKCAGQRAVLNIARYYVSQNKQLLLSRGIDPKILDC